jgi:hypothetical protein
MWIPARFAARHGLRRAIMAAGVGIALIAIGTGIALRLAQGPEPSAADTASVARDAATTETPQPATGFVSGRARCTLGPGAVPDCRLAAEGLCRSKGYGSGTVVDFEMAERCPPPYCVMDHFVTRALCQ